MDLLKVLMWRLEWDSNLWPSGRKALNPPTEPPCPTILWYFIGVLLLLSLLQLLPLLLLGVHPPEAIDAFPACFRFPLFPKKISDSIENFRNFTFSEKISQFSSTKLLMTFFSHLPQIWNFPPIFAVSIHSPYFAGNFSFPLYFSKFPLWFRKIYILCHFRLPPTLTMMHLCITQCMYWTPLTTTPITPMITTVLSRAVSIGLVFRCSPPPFPQM